jgi:colanic acid/amylovoran biosynthesis glycosyltransferase
MSSNVDSITTAFKGPLSRGLDAMLVVATPNPDSVAETFVRQHIRMVLPENTAVIFFEGRGKSIEGLPSLKVNIQPSKSKLGSLANLIAHGYAGTIVGEERNQIVSFLKKNDTKCLLAEFGQTACALKSACERAGVELYPFFHGQDASVSGKKLRNRYSFWRMGKYASRIFVGTHYFANRVGGVGIPREKITVAPFGLELDKFSSSKPKHSNLIVAVGRMVEKKAPHLTVEAFAKTLRMIPNARLEMIGDGPLLNHVKQLAISLGVTNSIVFHGAKDHKFVRQKISNAALFVQHSLTAPNGDTESFGITLLEAMACEVPIVATKHNGFVETVANGVTGFLVDEGDVDSMAARMVEVLNDKELRENMGKAGRERVVTKYDAVQQAVLIRKLMGL